MSEEALFKARKALAIARLVIIGTELVHKAVAARQEGDGLRAGMYMASARTVPGRIRMVAESINEMIGGEEDT